MFVCIYICIYTYKHNHHIDINLSNNNKQTKRGREVPRGGKGEEPEEAHDPEGPPLVQLTKHVYIYICTHYICVYIYIYIYTYVYV